MLVPVLGVVTGVLVVWVALVVVLARTTPGRVQVGEVLRLLPDVLRLVGRLARDPTVPRGVRVRLWLLLGYLASPVDLVPDIVPVVGYADDVLMVVVVLRSVLRRCGPEAVERHWPGSPDALTALHRLVGA